MSPRGATRHDLTPLFEPVSEDRTCLAGGQRERGSSPSPGLPGFGMCGDRVQSHRADLTIGDQYVERRFSPVWRVLLLQILHGFYTVLLL